MSCSSFSTFQQSGELAVRKAQLTFNTFPNFHKLSETFQLKILDELITEIPSPNQFSERCRLYRVASVSAFSFGIFFLFLAGHQYSLYFLRLICSISELYILRLSCAIQLLGTSTGLTSTFSTFSAILATNVARLGQHFPIISSQL